MKDELLVLMVGLVKRFRSFLLVLGADVLAGADEFPEVLLERHVFHASAKFISALSGLSWSFDRGGHALAVG